MKTGFLVGAASLLLLPIVASASTLGCWDVDGASIFGWDSFEDHYEFIGAVANEFDSDSIANEFGAGNEFSSKSIFNEFGDYGSEFSSESAFNDFASKPPILVDGDLDFIGYLTTNDIKAPNIHPWDAYRCAQDSFKSSERDHEDIEFTSASSAGVGSGPSSDLSDAEIAALIQELQRSSCPENSSLASNGKCQCNSGFQVDSMGDGCVVYSADQQCKDFFGDYSYAIGSQCGCLQGYEWNSTGTACVQSIACSANAFRVGNSCQCNSGYVMHNEQCVTHTQDCQLTFGNNVIGTPGSSTNSNCDCAVGYQWNATKTKCVVIPASIPESIVPTSQSEVSIPENVALLGISRQQKLKSGHDVSLVEDEGEIQEEPVLGEDVLSNSREISSGSFWFRLWKGFLGWFQ